MAVCYYNIVSHIKFNLSELPVVICGLTKYGQSSVNNLTLWVMADMLTHQVYVTSFYPSSKYVVWRTHIVRSREQVSFIQSCVSFECVFTHNYLCTQAYKHIVCNNWSDAFLIMWPTHAHRSNLVPLLTCPQLIQKGSAECLNLGGWEVLWYDLVCWWSHCIEAHLPTDQLVELPSTVIPPVLCIIGNMVTPLSTPTHPHTHTYPPTPTHPPTHTHTPHTTHHTPHTAHHTHTHIPRILRGQKLSSFWRRSKEGGLSTDVCTVLLISAPTAVNAGHCYVSLQISESIRRQCSYCCAIRNEQRVFRSTCKGNGVLTSLSLHLFP